jgi:hypothetical protein
MQAEPVTATYRPSRQPTPRQLIAAGVVVVAIAGMIADARATSVVRGPNVLVIGDSIMEQSAGAVRYALDADGWNATVDAQGGTAIQNWPKAATELVAADHPNVAVVELGTNNCAACPDLAPDINDLMRVLSHTDLVVWLNVQEDASYPSDAPWINQVLASTLVWWPNATMLDFSSHFAGHPAWHAGAPPGVHLSSAGQQQLARFITTALHPDRRR